MLEHQGQGLEKVLLCSLLNMLRVRVRHENVNEPVKPCFTAQESPAGVQAICEEIFEHRDDSEVAAAVSMHMIIISRT